MRQHVAVATTHYRSMKSAGMCTMTALWEWASAEQKTAIGAVLAARRKIIERKREAHDAVEA